MNNLDFYTRAIDLNEEEHFIDEAEAFDTALHAAAMLLIIQLRKLNQGMLTDKGVSELLDFIGPFGAGERCFNAWCYLNSGRLNGDYDDFTARLRRECRRAITSGRVKYAGQPRNRDRKKDTKTKDLFEFCAA